jgi:uncharacterized damage-inducible protein DinB
MDPASGEKESLQRLLDYNRETFLWKIEGLTDEQARVAPIEGSLLNPAGLLMHLALVEQWWFLTNFAGQKHPYFWDDHPDDMDAEFKVQQPLAEIIEFWNEQVTAADEVISSHALDDLSAVDHKRWGKRFTLRWVLLHLVQETARHNGHIDLIRELIDGGKLGE